MKKSNDVLYFLIFYIVVEILFFLGMIYYSISGLPSHELFLGTIFFYLLIVIGILAPIAFIVLKSYKQKKKKGF